MTKEQVETIKFFNACGGDFARAHDRLLKARDLLFLQNKRKSAQQVEIMRRYLVRVYG